MIIQHAYAKKQYSNLDVAGWVIIGIILAPTVILLILCLWVADKHSKAMRCSNCGNMLTDGKVTLCPACHSSIVSKKQYDLMIMQSANKTQPPADLVKTEPEHQKKLDQKIEFKFS